MKRRNVNQNFPNRRDLLKMGGLALAGTLFEPVLPSMNLRAAARTNPRGTARNCIFVEMAGAPSPMDCFDFKETAFTPKDLDVRKVAADLYLSHTLFPEMSKVASKFSFVRGMRTKELNHGTGQWHTQTGRSLNPAVAKEIPAYGTVIAYEMEKSRRETDTFPSYMSTGLSRARAGQIGSGFFAPRFSGVDLDPGAVFDSFGGKTGGTDGQLAENYEALQMLADATAKERGPLGSKETSYDAFYKIAYATLGDPRWRKVFQVSDEDKKRYGNTQFGLGALLARNLVAADAGARFIYVHDAVNWDNHANIFEKGKGLYAACAIWDPVFAALISDLSSMPGHEPGKTMLDETLIVAHGEFGRTPFVNNAAGRDHYNETFASIWAGGGVKPGRIIGKTNEDGAKCTETGWKHKEQTRPDNTVATIYSALGLDWGKSATHTPSGRAYEYVQSAPLGGSDFIANDAIDELFA